MNRKLLSVFFICLSMIIVGCSNNNDAQKKDLNNEHNEQSIPPAPEPNYVSEIELEGDIRNVYYANEDKLLVSADKLYLYDVKTESVLNEAPIEDFEQENIWVADDGYVAVRLTRNSNDGKGNSMMSDSGFNMIVKFYDQDLKEVSDFFLNQLYEDNELLISIDPISFSSDGKQMIYATSSALYRYDFEKNEKSIVVDLTSEDIEKRSGIVSFEQIDFAHDDKQIVFKAQTFDIPVDPNKYSFSTCGVVNVDGSKLTNKTLGDYICSKITAYNDILLLSEDPNIASGRTLVMELPEEKTKIHKLIDVSESGNVWGSNDGNYFATPIPTKTGWTIRIYDMKSGKLEGEHHVTIDGEKRYKEQAPVIKMVDDLRTYIVLLGSRRDDIPTKMVIGQF